MKCFQLAFLVLVTCLPPLQASAEFPRPPELEPAVAFWTRVFSGVSTAGGLLHDRDNLAVVYETLSFEEHLWHPARERKVNRRRQHYQQILRTLASGKRQGLSAEEQRVLDLWPEGVSSKRLKQAANAIRFQLGQADRFREGLIRAGAWLPHMYDTLDRLKLPRELAALPHVESSFNPDAWSRVGAAGIWQFTRPTGRQYLRVDHVVDQRMDPFAATEGAALLLRHNYSVTGDWGLAITAYNHGLAGIRRAARDTGSDNIADIIANYGGRNWGFASRNFYPSFLAAVHVHENADKYFGSLERQPPLESITLELPFYTQVDTVLAAFGIDRKTLRELNRGLMDPVWSGQKHLPRGYRLRLPADAGDRKQLIGTLARIDESRRYAAQIPDREHTVRRGEALSTIASRYNTSVRELVALNNIRNPHRVRAGATLLLPVAGETQPLPGEKYEVRPGDTLSGIAARAGLRTAELAAANGLDPERPIHPGTTLHLNGQVADTGGGTPVIPASDEPAAEGATAADKPTIALTRLEVPPRQPTATGRPAPPAGILDGISIAGLLPDNTEPSEPAPQPPLDPDAERKVVRTAKPPTAREQPDALATDPADYSVADNATIEIQAAETLGHYAEWLDLRASDLRRLNDLRFGTPLVIGQRLTLAFSEASPEQFEQRRKNYHKNLQQAFFEKHQITDIRIHRVASGDSLWRLTGPDTGIPLWLLRQYNPDIDFNRLQPGTEVEIPVLKKKEVS